MAPLYTIKSGMSNMCCGITGKSTENLYEKLKLKLRVFDNLAMVIHFHRFSGHYYNFSRLKRTRTHIATISLFSKKKHPGFNYALFSH
jgi:hypothetical protein